ncbi:MAG: SBBP repeat-containing protein [Thermosynechococcaceae cyanobacterium]
MYKHKDRNQYIHNGLSWRLWLSQSAILLSSLTVLQMPLNAGPPTNQLIPAPKASWLQQLEYNTKSRNSKAHFGGEDAWLSKLDKRGKILWKKQLGSASDDRSYAVATDSNSNVLISGTTLGTLPGPSEGGYDAWVAKYGPDGVVLWQQQLGTSGFDISFGVATDPSDNVLISGGTTGNLAGPAQGRYDAWVAKYSPEGLLQWKRQIGTPSDNVSYGVTTDSNGNVLISGTTSNLLRPELGSIAWVAKYAADGTFLWKKTLGKRTDGVSSYGVATDKNDNVLISGETTGSVDGPNIGSIDAWVAKYSSTGTLLWKRQTGTPDQDYSSGGVATDSSGNVLIALASYVDGRKVFVEKYNPIGTLIWKQQIGPRDRLASGITTDSNGNVLMSHSFFTGLFPDGAWIVKSSPNGIFRWDRTLIPLDFGSPSTGIATDLSGNAFITGYINRSFSGH